MPSTPAPLSILAVLGERFRNRGKAADLVRLSSHALTAQASLHAVRWRDEELLLGCTPNGVTVLARRPQPLPGQER
jgi:flagellar biogenesis protein FliO